LSDFERVYDEHVGYVWHSLRRLGVPSRDVEDVVQDTFVIVHRKLAEFDSERPLRPWLFGIAYRTALAYRRRAVQREVPTETPASGAVANDVEDEVTTRDRAYRLLQRIPPERRAVLIMHELDEMTAQEIADVLSIPLNTVYSRLRIARQEFGELAAQEAKEP
jgi:RNA polymerase sigma-70 factor (ECF subfamily)